MLIASSAISKPVVNVALAICLVLFVRDWRAGRVQIRRTPLDAPILAWILISVFAGLTSIDPLRSFRDLRNIGHWSAFYFVAWAVAGSARPVLLQEIWLGAGSLCVLQALLQLVFNFDLQGRDRPVPSGFFGGHLELGHFMVLLLALAIPRLASAETARERRVLFVAILGFGVSLVACGGRGPWLAFVAVVVTWAVLERRFAALRVLLLIALLQVAFLAGRHHGLEAFYRSYFAFENDAPAEIEQARVASNRWRISMWREGLQRFALRPVTGTGVETTGDLSQDFRTPFPDLAVAHLHSNYFEILMSRGFFGLAAFFWLMLVAVRWLLGEIGRHPPGAARAAVFAGVGGVVAHLVHGLTQFTFGASWIQMGFFIALGLAAGEWLRHVPAEGQETTIEGAEIRWGMLTIALCLLVTPWLAVHPVFASLLTTAACLDSAVRWVAGRQSSCETALTAAFAFVVVASLCLLAASPGLEGVSGNVMLAAGAPFGLSWATLRVRRFGLRTARPELAHG